MELVEGSLLNHWSIWNHYAKRLITRGVPLPIIENSFKVIFQSGITLNNVTESLNTTLTYTENPVTLSSEDIYYVANIVTQSSNLTGIQEAVCSVFMISSGLGCTIDTDKYR